MKSVVDYTLDLGVTIAAIVLVALVLLRATSPAQPQTERNVTYHSDWRSLVDDVGRPMTPQSAQITIVEFMDFECPFCARFDSDVTALMDEYPNEISRIFIHYPLTTIHRFAMPAANAAECAHAQGAFVTYAKLLFETQDSLGLIPWGDLAARAGVTDDREFEECIDSGHGQAAIDKGVELANALGFTGTPSLLINGWSYTGGMNADDLRSVVAAIRAGELPPGAD